MLPIISSLKKPQRRRRIGANLRIYCMVIKETKNEKHSLNSQWWSLYSFNTNKDKHLE